MTGHNLESVQEAGKNLIQSIDWEAVRDWTFGSSGGGSPTSQAGDKHFQSGGKEDQSLGLPGIKLSGFDQEAPDHETSPWKRLWHRFEDLVGQPATLSDHIKEKVVKDLKPEEAKKYAAEEKLLKEHEDAMTRWGLLATINPGLAPKAPDCPMHDEVNKRVAAAEHKITEQIRADMTPHERQRLDKQMREYQVGLKESRMFGDPVGTGGFYQAPPTPGNAVRDYWDRVKEQTEKFVGHSK